MSTAKLAERKLILLLLASIDIELRRSLNARFSSRYAASMHVL